MAIAVDLYSDTLTKPTDELPRFMCTAEVGDKQKGEDPTAWARWAHVRSAR